MGWGRNRKFFGPGVEFMIVLSLPREGIFELIFTRGRNI